MSHYPPSDLVGKFNAAFNTNIDWSLVDDSLRSVFGTDDYQDYAKVLIERALEVAKKDNDYRNRFFPIRDKSGRVITHLLGFALGIVEQVPLRLLAFDFERSHIVLVFRHNESSESNYEWVGVDVWQTVSDTDHLPRFWWSCTTAGLLGLETACSEEDTKGYEKTMLMAVLSFVRAIQDDIPDISPEDAKKVVRAGAGLSKSDEILSGFEEMRRRLFPNKEYFDARAFHKELLTPEAQTKFSEVVELLREAAALLSEAHPKLHDFSELLKKTATVLHDTLTSEDKNILTVALYLNTIPCNPCLRCGRCPWHFDPTVCFYNWLLPCCPCHTNTDGSQCCGYCNSILPSNWEENYSKLSPEEWHLFHTKYTEGF